MSKQKLNENDRVKGHM